MKQTSTGKASVIARIEQEVRNNVMHEFLTFCDRDGNQIGRVYYGFIINPRWSTNKEE